MNGIEVPKVVVFDHLLRTFLFSPLVLTSSKSLPFDFSQEGPQIMSRSHNLNNIEDEDDDKECTKEN